MLFSTYFLLYFLLAGPGEGKRVRRSCCVARRGRRSGSQYGSALEVLLDRREDGAGTLPALSNNLRNNLQAGLRALLRSMSAVLTPFRSRLVKERV